MTTMSYTEEQKTLIGGVISVQVLGRHLSDSLPDSVVDKMGEEARRLSGIYL